MSEAVAAGDASASPTSWLNRLGLHRPELRAWAMYDWANSVFMTTGLLIFPMFFSDVAADFSATEATRRFSIATVASMTLVAVLSPLLGAMADSGALKKKMLAASMGLGVLALGAMAWIGHGQWLFALSLFFLANAGVCASLVFYESLLPHVARADEIDRVSTAGYAVGYLGSGMLMALHCLWIQKPAWFGIPSPEAAIRLAFFTSALWWLGFSIPLFRKVPEPPAAPQPRGRHGLVAASFRQLGVTLRELRGYRETFLFLLAFLIYNDGIGTIIRMASSYGREIGIETGSLVLALLLVQFVGIPFSFLFGIMAGRIGAKASIFLSLGVYFGIAVVAYRMQTATHFFLLALMVGTVQGGSQALSRSVFASMVPRHKSSEFFGFYSVFEKFAGILGPALFSIIISVTGSSRQAILSVVVFFVVGGAILYFVDLPEGQRAAREAEARAAQSPA
jgi:UMF1 family MFS transporter